MSKYKDNSVLQNFGIELRKMRLAKGYSQEAFAIKCGVHRTYIGSIERGEQNVSLINIEKIAKALEMNISELLQNL